MLQGNVINLKNIDMAEQWLKENDSYFKGFRNKRKDEIEYPYLTSRQIYERQKREFTYIEDYQKQ